MFTFYVVPSSVPLFKDQYSKITRKIVTVFLSSIIVLMFYVNLRCILSAAQVTHVSVFPLTNICSCSLSTLPMMADPLIPFTPTATN